MLHNSSGASDAQLARHVQAARLSLPHILAGRLLDAHWRGAAGLRKERADD